jgi:hypothetical protein
MNHIMANLWIVEPAAIHLSTMCTVERVVPSKVTWVRLLRKRKAWFGEVDSFHATLHGGVSLRLES